MRSKSFSDARTLTGNVVSIVVPTSQSCGMRITVEIVGCNRNFGNPFFVADILEALLQDTHRCNAPHFRDASAMLPPKP